MTSRSPDHVSKLARVCTVLVRYPPLFQGTAYKRRYPLISDTVPQLQVSRIETKGKSFAGKTLSVKGKKATFKVKGSGASLESSPSSSSLNSLSPIHSVITIGKESPTSIEEQVRALALRVLCGDQAIVRENAIIRLLWNLSVPMGNVQGVGRPPISVYDRDHVPASVTVRLNDTQKRALQVFCTSDAGPAISSVVVPPPSSRLPGVIPSTTTGPHIQLVQGPPGTGKTTLIASIVQWLHGSPGGREGEALYIIAQSNVAVKRVAEKLADIGFLEFRLLVSEDFYLEW